MKHKKYILLAVFFLIIIVFLLFFRTNTYTTNLPANILSIPVDVYIIKYENENLSSSRNEENINEVFDKVNYLWSQANIKVEVNKIEVITIKDSNYYYDLNLFLSYMVGIENYNPDRVNAYFAKTLHGANGIAFPGNRIMVADKTTVYDFRATSHEIGHVLGLSHVGPVSRLMARGVNGFNLIEFEIEVARNKALELFIE